MDTKTPQKGVHSCVIGWRLWLNEYMDSDEIELYTEQYRPEEKRTGHIVISSVGPDEGDLL